MNRDSGSSAANDRLALVFDYGERRIGVASATTTAAVASALQTLPAIAGKPDWTVLDRLIEEWQPQVLVVGLPYNTDGSESAITARAREFAAGLSQRYRLPAELVDERLTSAEAASILREQRQEGLRRRRTRKQDVDRLAARLIAESWLRGAGENNDKDNGT